MVGAAIVDHAERISVGQLLLRHEVAAAQFDAIEPELPRSDVDQALHDEHHLGPTRTAIGPRRRGIAHHTAGAEMRGRYSIDARHNLDALLNHRVIASARAEIADVVATHREEMALGVEREFRVNREVAALEVAEQGFAAIGGPFHRAAEFARGPGHQHLLGEDLAPRSEVAADVADNKPHLVIGHAERGGQLPVQSSDRTIAGMDRVFSGGGIVFADCRARLHRRSSDPRHPGLELGNVLGAREGGLGRSCIADQGVNADIRAVVLMQQGSARLGCIGCEGHMRQRRVVDGDPLGAVLRRGDRFPHHDGERLSDKACLVVRQREVRRGERR